MEKIKRLMKAPSLLFRGLNRLYHGRFGRRPYNTEGVDVFEEDWDNLIILDAARYELFEEKLDTEKYTKFTSKVSRGSNSYEFVLGNFFDKDLTDTVYFTANGHIMWMRDELDGKVSLNAIEDFDREEGEEHGTHLPSTVREKSEALLDEYDDKRIVIHFMQPHYPFLGDNDVPKKVENFWYKVYAGEVDVTREELWEAYEENFEIVWEEVEKLLDSLEGKTVITADHGDMFGERSSPFPNREWGHPHGIYTEELVKVPWLVVDDGERREIVKGEREGEDEDYDEEEIKSQLADLGYGG